MREGLETLPAQSFGPQNPTVWEPERNDWRCCRQGKNAQRCPWLIRDWPRWEQSDTERSRQDLPPAPTTSSVPSCTPTPLPTLIPRPITDTSFSFLFLFLPFFLPLPLSLLSFPPSLPPHFKWDSQILIAWNAHVSIVPTFAKYALQFSLCQLGLPLNENKEGPSLSYVGYLAPADIGFSGCKHCYGFSGRPLLFQWLTILRTGGSSMLMSHGNVPKLGMRGLGIPRWHPPALWPWVLKCPSCLDPSCLRERSAHVVQQTFTEGYGHPHPV